MGLFQDWLHRKLTGEVRTEVYAGVPGPELEAALREEIRKRLRRPSKCPHGFLYAMTRITVEWGIDVGLTASPQMVARYECCHDEHRAGTFRASGIAEAVVIDRPVISPQEAREMREEDEERKRMFEEHSRDLRRRRQEDEDKILGRRDAGRKSD